jgi:ferrous iron transport protein B
MTGQNGLATETGGRKIVLAGNPNVGKSVIFQFLTGQYVEVSNYPGTTVETSWGRYREDTVIDAPGIYGLSSFNDEERVARDVILDADLVVNVVNAARIRQDLFLTLQLLDAGLPVIVVLNMMDEARANGVTINREKLSEMLGVKVVECSAVQGEGFDGLKRALEEGPGTSKVSVYEQALKTLPNNIPVSHRLLILEGDPEIAERYHLEPRQDPGAIYEERRNRADRIADAVIGENLRGARFHVKLGRMMVRPLTGIPLLILTLIAIFYLLGNVIATQVVGFTEEKVMGEWVEPLIRGLVERLLPNQSPVAQILAGKFGILTMGLNYLFGLLLPLVIGFYLLLGILEDSGYLPRIAVLTDRILTKIGLNGRAIIPIILGFGCVTMATVSTRLLGTRRERFIATILLGIAIPCSAQLGVIAGMIMPLGIGYTLIYGLTILGIFGLMGLVMNKVLPGESSGLLIELPPIRMPQLKNLLRKTWQKTKHFIVEAFPLFILGAIILSIVDLLEGLKYINELARPLMVGWLGLPKETATTFAMGILRRDFGAAGLTSLSLTHHQTLVALVTMTLFVPCIAAFFMMLKERGWKEGIMVWFGSLGLAFLTGGLIHRLVF